MNNFLNKTKKILLIQQRGIFSSALLISAMIVISKFFGFLRYRVLTGFFTKEELDIFFASFRIPDLVFDFLISGALSSAFIPIIIKYKNQKEKFNLYISSIINLILLATAILIFFLFIFADWLIPLITPGYSLEKTKQITYFSRILLIGQLPFMIAGNLLIGLAQAYKIFIITTLAPILYNLTIIIFTLLLAKHFFLQGSIIGVIIGSFLFFISQLPILFKIDFNYFLVFKITESIKEFFKIIIPRFLTTLTAQIDATIDLILTSILGEGNYTIFYFAQHLQLLPISVVGMALAQASLPYISELYQQRKISQLKKIISDSILNLLFLIIPIAFLFIFARTPLIRLFFGGEKFDWTATVLSAYSLSYFAISLPFHSVYYFITRCFYAFLEAKIPLQISAINIVLNTTLSLIFIFVFHLPVWSLSISFSISMIFNVLILSIILFKKIDFFKNIIYFILEIIKIFFSGLLAAIPSYFALKILSLFFLDLSRTINVLFLIITVFSFYILLYLFFSWFLNVKEIKIIKYFLLKTKEYQKKVIEIYNQYE